MGPAAPVAPASAGTSAADTRRAVRNLVWLSGDKFASVLLGLLVFGLIARHAGPQGAGAFSYGVALLQTALGLSLVCSSAAVLPRLCQLSPGVALRAVGNVFVVRCAGSVLAALAVAVYALWAIDDPTRRHVTLLMLATVPLLEPFNAAAAFWLSRNRNRAPVIARITGLLVRLVVVAVALALGADLWVVALAWVAEALTSAALQAVSLGAAAHRWATPWTTLRRAVRAPRARRYLQFGLRFAAGLWLSHLFLRLDRLWLAERMDPHAFGLYATAMQLVEVWMQAAILLAGSMAPAFLYHEVRRSTALRDHRGTLLALAGLGLAGLAAAALFGHWVLVLVFGKAFAPAYGVLVAGCGAAVLFFVDQWVQISITANNRPGVLALKWASACAICVATLALATPRLGPMAGPLALALGVLAGWVAVALTSGHRARTARP